MHNRAAASMLPALTAVFVAVVCSAILALSGWGEWQSRNFVLKNAEIETTNLARSLNQHAEDTFELADSILTGIVSRLESEGTSPASIAKLQRILDLRKPSLGRIHGLFVYDEAGRWLATTENVELTTYNNSDRDYFRQHRNTASPLPLIGQPVKSKSGGQWIIPISRRFNNPDGSFAGVALATIDVSYFTDFYQQFDIGSLGTASLISKSGTILARVPLKESNIGRDLSNSPIFLQSLQAPSGARQFVSSLDHVERIGFFEANSRFPFVVAVTKAESDVLSRWRRDLYVHTAIVVGLVAMLALLGLYLVGALYRRRQLMDALAAKEADFRSMAEESSDMITRIGFDGRILYASPSSARLLGWRPDQMVGKAALAGANAEDLPRLEQTVAQLRSGEIGEARLIYRNRHKERSEIWVESTLRATRSDAGEIDGVVAITRDITQQKDLEQKLAALAIQDSLTGLANRRRFDEQLQHEWSRARRERNPLALLLIDVDNFKKFNDCYGHPAGDQCLRAISKAFATSVQRPGDLVARIGGEEFAILLPNTDTAGCQEIGARIRQAVAELDIPHEQNRPHRKVTVSIGAAIADPKVQAMPANPSIVGLADKALYAAKRDGRNRLVFAGGLRSIDSAA